MKSKTNCDELEHARARKLHAKFIGNWVEISESVLDSGMLKVHLSANESEIAPKLTSGIGFFIWGTNHSTKDKFPHKALQLQMQFNKPVDPKAIETHRELTDLFPQKETVAKLVEIFKSVAGNYKQPEDGLSIVVDENPQHEEGNKSDTDDVGGV